MITSPAPSNSEIHCRSVRPTLPGFTLVELLVVMGVITVILSLLAPVVGSVLSGRNLSRALDVISNNAVVARETAMNRGNPVALVVTQSVNPGVNGSQAVMLLSAPATSTGSWVPVGAWTKVPSGIQMDVLSRSGQKSFYTVGKGPLTSPLPVNLNGKAVSAYDYIVFYPDGSVNAPADGPALTFRRLNNAAASTDYTMVVQSNSGRTKIIQ